MRARLSRTLVVGLLCLPLASCADTAAQDLCGQYEGLVTAVEELRAQDPVQARVEDLRARSEEVRAELDEFQAVSEGRLDAAISRLRAEIDALRQAAVEGGTEALETARPLIEDALEEIARAWAVVQDLAATQCPEGA